MKKICTLLFVLISATSHLFASHIIGAEISYTHINGLNYKVRLKLYRDCTINTNQLLNLQIIDVYSLSQSQSLNFVVDSIAKEKVHNYCDSTLTSCDVLSAQYPGS
ncbi:MAG: hypothetical protein R2831_07535 [Chitinophagaceae bacterium]